MAISRKRLVGLDHGALPEIARKLSWQACPALFRAGEKQRCEEGK
jgi:hypothetical protein